MDTTPPVVSGQSGTVSWSDSNGTLTAQNTLVQLRWDATTGALVGLKNLTRGTELLAGTRHASWSAAVDSTTGDLWSARAPMTTSGREPTTLAAFEAVGVQGGVRFDLRFAALGPLRVVQHVTLFDGDPVAHWTTDATVATGSHATLIELASPDVLGVTELAGESLAWPWHEGVIFESPGASLQTMSYPSLASMQWMELFTKSEGLYYAALDASGGYKVLDFGYDPALGDSSRPREMRISFHPFATPGQTYSTPEVELGVASEGGWYWGADRYRAFLAGAGMMRAPSNAVRTLLGWHKGYDRWPRVPPDLPSRPPDVSYCDIPLVLMPPDYTALAGLSTLLVYGWHYDGQDSFFPDYAFLSKNAPDATCLQGSDLATALQTLASRSAPNRVMFYINGHIADVASDWMQNPTHATSAVVGADGSPYVETYPDQPGRSYRVMCPSAALWQEQLDATAVRLRTLAPVGAGAFGVYWDQVEEEPAYLCYDRNHGHTTPATAYAEGYAAMFARIHQDFSLGGTDTDYVFAAEGSNDFYSQFIDVAAGMPGRLLGFAGGCGAAWSNYPCCPSPGCVAAHAPQIARYTLLAKQLGLSNYVAAGATPPASEEFTRAFLLGDPLRTNPPTDPTRPYTTTNLSVLPRYTAIYSAEPTIYLEGTFKDAMGLSLSVDTSHALATVILGRNLDRLGVQLWNETGASLDIDVTVDLDRFGLVPTSDAALADLDGLAAPALSVARGVASFTVTVPAHDVKAMRITL